MKCRPNFFSYLCKFSKFAKYISMTDLSSLIRQSTSDKSIIAQLNQRVEALRKENLKLRQVAHLDTYYVLYVPKLKKEVLKTFFKRNIKSLSFWLRKVWAKARDLFWPEVVREEDEGGVPVSEHAGFKHN